MEVTATAKWVRVPPRKARLVGAVVQGMPVSEALTVLAFMPKAAANDVAKVIRSAAANAQNNFNLEAERLRLTRLEVNGGPIIKRFRPRARGAYFSIFKRTCHLRAVVEDTVEPTPRGGGRRSRSQSDGKPAALPVEPAAVEPEAE